MAFYQTQPAEGLKTNRVWAMRELHIPTLLDITTPPELTEPAIGFYSGSLYVWDGAAWVLVGSGAGGTPTLQEVVDEGNESTTKIVLAASDNALDPATEAQLEINNTAASGTAVTLSKVVTSSGVDVYAYSVVTPYLVGSGPTATTGAGYAFKGKLGASEVALLTLYPSSVVSGAPAQAVFPGTVQVGTGLTSSHAVNLAQMTSAISGAPNIGNTDLTIPGVTNRTLTIPTDSAFYVISAAGGRVIVSGSQASFISDVTGKEAMIMANNGEARAYARDTSTLDISELNVSSAEAALSSTTAFLQSNISAVSGKVLLASGTYTMGIDGDAGTLTWNGGAVTFLPGGQIQAVAGTTPDRVVIKSQLDALPQKISNGDSTLPADVTNSYMEFMYSAQPIGTQVVFYNLVGDTTHVKICTKYAAASWSAHDELKLS